MSQSLLIVATRETHELVAATLRSERVELHHAFDAGTGLAFARQHAPDVVLLELDLGGASGLDVCRQLKADPATAAIPLVGLTAITDVASREAAFELGADDFVTKPLDAIELRARVRVALRSKRYQDLLATSAQRDPMTGLWNRTFFDTRLDEELAAGRRHGQPLALAMLEVDQCQTLSETYGRPFGEAALCRVAEALLRSVRRTDVVCRYGAEDFGVILRGTGDEASLLCAERMRATIEALELAHDGTPVTVTASVGVAASDDLAAQVGLTRGGLAMAADHARYRATHAGRNQVVRAALDRSDLSS